MASPHCVIYHSEIRQTLHTVALIIDGLKSVARKVLCHRGIAHPRVLWRRCGTALL